MPLTSSSSSTLFNFQFHGSKWTLQSHTNQTHFSSLQLHKTLFVFYPGPSNNPIRPTIQQYQTSNSKRKWKRTWRFPSIFSFFSCASDSSCRRLICPIFLCFFFFFVKFLDGFARTMRDERETYERESEGEEKKKKWKTELREREEKEKRKKKINFFKKITFIFHVIFLFS